MKINTDRLFTKSLALLLNYTGELNIAMKIRLCYFDSAGIIFILISICRVRLCGYFLFQP